MAGPAGGSAHERARAAVATFTWLARQSAQAA